MLLFYFFALFSFCECGKIAAIFPFPSRSHHILGHALLKELANRGHEVTMISPFSTEAPIKNYKQVYLDGVTEWKNINDMADTKISRFQKMMKIFNGVSELGEVILKSKNLQNYIDSKPDVDVLIHMSLFNEALFGISHYLNASLIPFSVAGSNSFTSITTGNPMPYAYVPNIFLSYTDNMNFFQRTVNTLVNVLTNSLVNFMILPNQQKKLSKYFPDAPPLTELIQNIDLVLVNSHFSTETPRPYLPNLIQIGGFHLQEKQEMSADLKTYLDSPKKTIYFSLGTNIQSSTLTTENIKDILSVFEKYHQFNFLWKSDQEFTNKPENVRIGKWFPQRAVLGHPNVIAFITHGGLGSTVEAIYNGVPMICIPYFGDQQKNVADSVAKGYAIHLDPTEINKEFLSNAIKEITENVNYRDKIKLISDLYANQVMNPMDKAIYWVEYVLKHKKASIFKSRANVIPWYQIFLLDVFLFIFAVLTIFCILICFTVKKMYSLCNKKSVESIKKAKTS